MSEVEFKLPEAVRATQTLTGKLASNSNITGKLTSRKTLTGQINLPAGYETYKGSYEVTPKIKPQIVDTKNKTMTNDITVKGIPAYEVSNTFGGTTFVIGGGS